MVGSLAEGDAGNVDGWRSPAGRRNELLAAVDAPILYFPLAATVAFGPPGRTREHPGWLPWSLLGVAFACWAKVVKAVHLEERATMGSDVRTASWRAPLAEPIPAGGGEPGQPARG
jgi:hypothetical protein